MLTRPLAFLCFSMLVAACGSSATSGGSSTTTTTTTGAGGSGGTGGSTATGGTGGTTGAGGGACATTPTFGEVLSKPLSSCSGVEPPCHNTGAGSLHISPSDAAGTWKALVNVAASTPGAGTLVVPGDPAHSFLYRKLIHDLGPNDGDPMPKSGLATGWNELPADELETMRCWILGGAKQN